MTNQAIRVILDNLRGSGNVGSILRTSDAVQVERVYATGTTPYPRIPGDTRPEHVIQNNTRQIAKTALGAEVTMPVTYHPDTLTAVSEVRAAGFIVIVLEQTETSLSIANFKMRAAPVALVVGNEVGGVASHVIRATDTILELPMLGHKESLNVAVATGIALYHFRFNLIRKN